MKEKHRAEDAKKVKSSKAPKIFQKNRAESRFQKRILAKTFSEKDNSFLNGIMEKNEKGEYQLPEELTREELKRLKGIAKTVKQNTGVVAFGKIVLLGVVIGGVLVFNLVFKDMILESLLESNLSEVFDAQVDFRGLSLDLANTRIAFQGLEIANKDKPMENLLQLGVTQFDLDSLELLKGKFVVNDISCREIQWNTPRRVSGALASRHGSSQSVQADPGPAESGAIALDVDSGDSGGLSLDFDQIDTQKIMEEAKSQITSMKKIEESSTKLQNLKKNYSARIEQFNKELSSLKTDVQKIAKLDFSKMDLARARTALTTISSTYNRLNILKNQFDELSTGFKNDSKAVKTMSSEIEAAVKSDYALVEGFIQAPEAGAAGLVSAVAEPILKEQLGDIYSYGQMALELAKKIDFSHKREEPGEVPVEKIRRRGLDIPFPEKNNPAILIKKASFSIGSEKEGDSFGVSLKAFSSEPELMNRPAELEAFLKNNLLQADILCQIDVRKSAENVLNTMIGIKDLKLDLDNALEGLGFADFQSDLQLNLNLIQTKEGALLGDFNATLNQLKTASKEGLNKVTQEVYNIISRARDISFSGDFTSQADSLTMNMKSSLDKLLEQAVGELINKSLSEARNRLRSELDKYIGSFMDNNKELYAVYQDMEALLVGNESDLDSFQTILDNKKAEAEKRIKAIGEQAGDALKNEADKQINNLMNNFGL